MDRNIRLCTLRCAQTRFGVDLRQVHGVLAPQELTHVPLALPWVLGLVNLRGEILIAIDLRRRLGLAVPDDAPPGSPLLVVRSFVGLVGLRVDEVQDLREVPRTEIERPSESLAGVGRALVQGVVMLEGRPLLVLDPDRLLEHEIEGPALHAKRSGV